MTGVSLRGPVLTSAVSAEQNWTEGSYALARRRAITVSLLGVFLFVIGCDTKGPERTGTATSSTASGNRSASDSTTSSQLAPPLELTEASLSEIPSTMRVDPGNVPSGTEFGVEFSGPLRDSHGAFYILSDSSGAQVAGLWSDKFNEIGIESPGYTTDLDSFEILDFPVIDGTPDRLLIPPSLDPGRYRVCTANSRPEVCAEVMVT